jgi:CubicO group peptidase (beta-lactamase class C family)
MKMKMRGVTRCLFAIALSAASTWAGEINLKDLATNANIRPINRTMEVSDDALYFPPSGGGGMVWIPDVDFSEGVIEVELRGRNAVGRSFVGVAFHAEGAETYDAIYLRPFNFQSDDPVRRQRAIQYISIPGHDWPDLRADRPGKYEAALEPAPKPEAWCKLRVAIQGNQLEAFVNGAPKASLRVNLLNKRLKGKVGLWVGNNSDGWFRQISVKGGAAVSEPKEHSLQSKIPGWMKDLKVPVATVAVIESGEVKWSEVFHADGRADGRPRKTHFNVASMTKPVFAMMALHLVKERAICLDESLERYWVDPDIASDPRHRKLTPRICLNHQTGFPNWRREGKLKFEFTPGEKTQYSGEGYEYLKRALERKTGQTMEQLVDRYVFKPAGMSDSFLTWRKEIEATFSGGYDRTGNRHPDFKQTDASAADDLLTTVEDYAMFVAWVLKGAGLPEPLFREMARVQDPGQESGQFGLGWQVWMQQPRLLSHGGSDQGVNCEMVLALEPRNAVVVLTASENGDLLIRSVLRKAFEQGNAFLKAKDLSTWKFVEHMPAEEFSSNLENIKRSPAIMDKLLNAVLARFEDEAGLSEAEKTSAREACARLVASTLRAPEDQKSKIESVMSNLTKRAADSSVSLNHALDPADLQALITILEN